MLTGGHIAASYLLAETAKSFGVLLTGSETLGIIITGNIIDLDFFVGFLTGKTGEAHHQNISHTPAGILLVWIIANLLFHPSFTVALLLLISMCIHLVLDEIGYWAYRLKFYKSPVGPQVNWLYPITPFHKRKLIMNTKDVLKYYLFNAWPISLTEMAMMLVALFTFFLKSK